MSTDNNQTDEGVVMRSLSLIGSMLSFSGEPEAATPDEEEQAPLEAPVAAVNEKKAKYGPAAGAGSVGSGADGALTALKGALGVLSLISVILLVTVVVLILTGGDSETVVELEALSTRGPPAGDNPCHGKKPTDGFENFDCFANNVVQALEQAGANVTRGYNGDLETDAVPITDPYWKQGLCPVNVHWHLGAEHLSVGEYDETGSGPSDIHHRRKLAGMTREGFQCTSYDASNPIFTTEYDWKHCIEMEVGQTYEVHWPHSRAGKCGTINQYQTPFYDGVFCEDEVVGGMLDANDARTTFNSIGVQAQVFIIVNDERYYYPDLIRGMIVDGDHGSDMAKYTGSTTGTSRNNEICSAYAPITWQVDRKCHMISASSFDKMCADMKAQRDDMSDDLYAHGARELVDDRLAADNHATRF